MDIEFRVVPRSAVGIGDREQFEALIGIKDIVSDVFASKGVRKLPDDVMDEINQIVEDFIISSTKEGFDADGGGFEDLTDDYRKRKVRWGMDGKADLYARRSSIGGALDNFHIKRDGQSNRSVGEFDYKNQEMYMGIHQTGEFPQPQRKFFPDEESFASSHYQNVVKDVQDAIHEYILRRMGA